MPTSGRVAGPRRAAAPAAPRGRRCRVPRCAAAGRAVARRPGRCRRAPESATAAEPLEEAVEIARGRRRVCVIANCAPASTFRRKRSSSTSRSSGGRVDGDAEEERGRRVDRPAVEVLAAVQPRHQLVEPDRVDLVDAARARVVADLGRVAGDGEDVADALGVGAEQHRLQAHHGVVARRQVRDRLDAGRRARSRPRPSASSCRRGRSRVVVDVDEADLPGVLQRLRELEQAR